MSQWCAASAVPPTASSAIASAATTAGIALLRITASSLGLWLYAQGYAVSREFGILPTCPYRRL
jgi:hypothetical protein